MIPRNYTFYEDKNFAKRPQTWFGEPAPVPQGAGSAAPASSALAASAKASAPPPPPLKRKAPPRPKVPTEEPKASASATADVDKGYKAPPPEVPQQVPHPREVPGVVRDPRIYQVDRPCKNPLQNCRRVLALPHQRNQGFRPLALTSRTVIRTLQIVQENRSALPLTITTSWICTSSTISTQPKSRTILTTRL